MSQADATRRSLRSQGWLTAAGRAFVDLIFPPRCAGCGAAGGFFCPGCIARLDRLPDPCCRRCARPLMRPGLCQTCLRRPSPLTRIASVAHYTAPLREAIHRFKYGNLSAASEALSDLMAERWNAEGFRADVIVPVPLHRDRLRERGYNQSALLARGLARRVGIPAEEGGLVRMLSTPPQVGLTLEERHANVAGAFAVPTSAALVAGRCVVLLDDVCTTGATLQACATALRAAGAVEVWGFTLARADHRLEPPQDTPGH